MLYQSMMVDPQYLSAQYRLGNHNATYKQSYIQFVMSIVACGIFIVGGISVAWWSFTYLSPNGACLGICALVLAVGFLIALPNVYQGRVKRVFVYDNGMIHVGRKSLQTIIYWKDVETVFHEIKVYMDGNGGASTSHAYIVRCTDGTSLKLDGIFGKQRLGTSIEVVTARYLFPAALNTYQMNHTVDFGPLTVTPQGLYHGSKLLPWGELKSIQINNGIVIKKKGKWLGWASVEMAKVPNVEVFRMLVDHITGERP